MEENAKDKYKQLYTGVHHSCESINRTESGDVKPRVSKGFCLASSQWNFFNSILSTGVKLSKSLFMRIRCRTNGVPIRKGPVTTRRLPVTPEVNRTDGTGCDSFACQRCPVGDP